MDERLNELVKQCTWQACWPGDPDAGDFDKERFATLIVEECAEVCFARGQIITDRNEKSDDKLLNSVKAMTYNIAGECIKEHFGVK